LQEKSFKKKKKGTEPRYRSRKKNKFKEKAADESFFSRKCPFSENTAKYRKIILGKVKDKELVGQEMVTQVTGGFLASVLFLVRNSIVLLCLYLNF